MDNSKQLKSFLSGSWKTYAINGLEDTNFTPVSLNKDMKKFSEDYKISSEFFAVDDIICILLSLETLTMANKKKRPKKNEKPVIHKYKLVLCPDDNLLFCHRLIPAKIQENLVQVLGIVSLDCIDKLSGSQPDQLLLLHRQAKIGIDGFSTLNEVHGSNGDKYNETFSQIGPDLPNVPRIKKLSCLVEKASVLEDENSSRSVYLNAVTLDLTGPSLFHYYLTLAKKDYISSVPAWIANCRTTGKTHRRIRLE